MINFYRSLGHESLADEIQLQGLPEDWLKRNSALNTRFRQLAFSDERGSTINLIDGSVTNNLASSTCDSEKINIISNASKLNPYEFSEQPKTNFGAIYQTVNLLYWRSELMSYEKLHRRYLGHVQKRPCTSSDLVGCSGPVLVLIDLVENIESKKMQELVSIPTRLKGLDPEQQEVLIQWGQKRARKSITGIVEQSSNKTR